MSHQIHKALPGKLYAKSEECGKEFTSKNGSHHTNACLYMCIKKWINSNDNRKEKFHKKEIMDIGCLKNILTFNLPFSDVIAEDPSCDDGLADHRVLLRFSDMFKINIYLLHRGSSMYYFGNDNPECDKMYILLRNNHFTLVIDKISILRMIECFNNPDFVLFIKPEKKGKHRRKRGKEKIKDYKNAVIGKNSTEMELQDLFRNRYNVLKYETDLVSTSKKNNRRGKRK